MPVPWFGVRVTQWNTGRMAAYSHHGSVQHGRLCGQGEMKLFDVIYEHILSFKNGKCSKLFISLFRSWQRVRMSGVVSSCWCVRVFASSFCHCLWCACRPCSTPCWRTQPGPAACLWCWESVTDTLALYQWYRRQARCHFSSEKWQVSMADAQVKHLLLRRFRAVSVISYALRKNVNALVELL